MNSPYDKAVCDECQEKDHLHCQGMTTTGWCECPCHTGEMADPLVGRGVQDVPAPRKPH